MPLVINSLGRRHTHAHTYTNMHVAIRTGSILRNQACAGLWLARAWFNNVKKFTVRRCSLNHCYPTGQDILSHYPFKQRLDSDQLKELQDIVALGPKLKLV